jgi:hypothetical protein
MCTHNTHTHDCPIYWFGTDPSINKNAKIKLEIRPETFPLSEMMHSFILYRNLSCINFSIYIHIFFWLKRVLLLCVFFLTAFFLNLDFKCPAAACIAVDQAEGCLNPCSGASCPAFPDAECW